VTKPVGPKIEKPIDAKTVFKEADDIPTSSHYWDDAKLTGGQLGSNTGGQYTGPDGQKFYLKKYNNMAQADAEIFSGKIYDMLGIKTPNTKVITKGGEKFLASKWLDDVKPLGHTGLEDFAKANPELMAQLHVVSAFTKNWDVIGLSFDNIALVKGKLHVLDTGGSFTFRAQGGKKDYGAETGLDDFITKNASASVAFKNLYKDTKTLDAALSTAHYLKSNLPYIAKHIPSGISLVDEAVMLKKLDNIITELTAKHTKLTAPAPPKAKPLKAGEKPPYMNDDDWKFLGDWSAKAHSYADGTGIRTEARTFARDWGGSSTSNTTWAPRAHIADAFGFTGEDAYDHEMQLRNRSKYDPTKKQQNGDTYRTAFAHFVKPETTAQIYRENQAILRAKHPSGKVKLYRGIGGYTSGGTELKQLITDAFSKGQPAVVHMNWLNSFTTSKSTAMHWQSASQNGIVFEIEVPIEMVFAETRWLKDHGNPHSESEYILIGTPQGYTLTPDQAHVYTNSSLQFAEVEMLDIRDRDPFHIFWDSSEDEAEFPRSKPLPESEQDWTSGEGWK
jgi:hypothetical protein